MTTWGPLRSQSRTIVPIVLCLFCGVAGDNWNNGPTLVQPGVSGGVAATTVFSVFLAVKLKKDSSSTVPAFIALAIDRGPGALSR